MVLYPVTYTPHIKNTDLISKQAGHTLNPLYEHQPASHLSLRQVHSWPLLITSLQLIEALLLSSVGPPSSPSLVQMSESDDSDDDEREQQDAFITRQAKCKKASRREGEA